MKTNVFSFILVSINLFLFSCDVLDKDVVPEGKVTTTNATYNDYTIIDASSAFTVYVTFSDTEESIEIEANDNLHQYIEVKKENNILKIGIDRNINVRGSATLNAYITTKHVSGYSASGASRFFVENTISSDEANIYLSGASTFTGELNVNRLNIDLSGASVLNIQGKTDTFDATASGASMVKDYGFETNMLIAELSGASNMYVTVDEGIDIEASGASILHYKGSAAINYQNLSGAASVKKMN